MAARETVCFFQAAFGLFFHFGAKRALGVKAFAGDFDAVGQLLGRGQIGAGAAVKNQNRVYAVFGDVEIVEIFKFADDFHGVVPFQAALGTIGGGNHFAELQVVGTVYAPDSLPAAFNPQCLQLLVHSGSRGLGQHILRRHVDKFSHAGLPENTPEAAAYLAEHDNALAFACDNRRLIAERMLARWNAEGVCLLDVHHNFLQSVQIDNQTGWLHRKGATPSDCGLVVIPGSRGDYSYLVRPIVDNAAIALFSLAHGAGRKWQRGECKARLSHKFSADSLRQTVFGSAVVCADKALIFEEAPQAYKKIDSVIAALRDFGLIEPVARMKPVLTYKTAGGCAD